MKRLIYVLVAIATLLASPLQRSAGAAIRWAPASKASIHPGVQTDTTSGQCTSNFVFYDTQNVYIGQAAHCSTRGGPFDTDGCLTNTLPLGAPVRIQGASRPGSIVYNSWNAMRAAKEKNANTCAGNDFALVRLSSSDRGRVNPSIPFWGGPTGLQKSIGAAQTVYTWGNSSLRNGITQLSPKFGATTFDSSDGWSHGFYTVTPGIPGDSGSAVLGPKGAALGVLVTLDEVPPGQNDATDLYRALSYMKAHTPALRGVTLANGTERFSGLP